MSSGSELGIRFNTLIRVIILEAKYTDHMFWVGPNLGVFASGFVKLSPKPGPRQSLFSAYTHTHIRNEQEAPRFWEAPRSFPGWFWEASIQFFLFLVLAFCTCFVWFCLVFFFQLPRIFQSREFLPIPWTFHTFRVVSRLNSWFFFLQIRFSKSMNI